MTKFYTLKDRQSFTNFFKNRTKLSLFCKKASFSIYLLLFPIIFSQSLSAQRLVNPNATAETKAVKKYMDDVYGKKIISGQCNSSWVPYIKTVTGKEPAIIAYDFNHCTPTGNDPNWNDDQKAIKWFKERGGIPAFQWHWQSPDGTGTWNNNDFNLGNALANTGSSSYKNMMRDIDIVAGKIKNMQDAGVPLIWRPVHEAEGDWFWWGHYGKDNCVKLYRLMYDRFVNFWHLNNIIWVWNSYGTAKGANWYPGDDVVDIVAYDYEQSGSWSEYQQLFGGKGKLFGLAEEGTLPDPNNFAARPWSFFVTWDYMIQEPTVKDGKNTKEWLKQVYNDPRTVTLSDLPVWVIEKLVANAGTDKTLIDNLGTGRVLVSLDGSASKSLNGVINSYQWSENGVNIASGVKINTELPLGSHTIKLTVADGVNPSTSTTVVITIKQPNAALGKPVFVSSTEVGTNVATFAVDGDNATRWASLSTDPQWIYVDLQKNSNVTGVLLSWETASAKDYRVEISTDAINWTVLSTQTGLATGARVDNIGGLNGFGRYVRVFGTARTSTWGFSLFEFEVYQKNNVKHVSSISLPAEASLLRGTSGSLSVVILPDSATDKTVKWVSSHPAIATVDANGKVNALTPGSTNITVTSNDMSLSATCWFHVTGDYRITATQTNGGTISPVGVSEVVGRGSLTYTITPNANFTISDLLVDGISQGSQSTFSFINVIADHTIQANFIAVKPVNLALKKTVTVSSTEATNGNIASNAVDGLATTRWSSVYADPQWLQVDLGSNYTLSSLVLSWEAASAKDYKVEVSTDGNNWTLLTSKTAMATGARVDNITGLSGFGRYVKLTGTARNTQWGYSLYELEVYGSQNIKSVTGVSLTPSTLSLNKGAKQQLLASVLPVDASNKAVVYTSSVPSVASVDANGLVTSLAAGTTIITVKTVDGGFTAISNVDVIVVNIPVTSVSLSPRNISFTQVGQNQQLSATILPSNATNSAVSFTTNDVRIANVNATGLITAVANGTTLVKVRTLDGNKMDSVVVNVSISQCTINSRFSVPGTSALSAIDNVTYPYLFVLGTGGPTLSNVSSTIVQWSLQYNGLWQFAFNTNNGSPAWYVNLLPATTQTLASNSPACTIKGSGFAGLDGDYWATKDGSNFVLVAKSGTFALYFSLTNTQPSICPVLKKATLETDNQTEFKVYPSLLDKTDVLKVLVSEGLIGSRISINDISGKQMIEAIINSSETTIGINNMSSGIYIVKIENAILGTMTQKVIVR